MTFLCCAEATCFILNTLFKNYPVELKKILTVEILFIYFLLVKQDLTLPCDSSG